MTGGRRQHNRKAPRPNSLRKDGCIQDSLFFKLPPEIRNQIYALALTKYDRKIDLWPYAKIDAYEACNDPSDRALQRAAGDLFVKHVAQVDTNRQVYLYFRDQQDLRYVRKHLSVALLRTCRQVYHEAFAFFYRQNLFRFSDDILYIGLRRFLTTIGPRARQELQLLQLAYPDAFVSDHTQFVHQEAEHYPALSGFAPVYLDGFLIHWKYELEDNPEITESNTTFVSELIRTEMRDTLKEIQFVITKGNWFRVELQSCWSDMDNGTMTNKPILVEALDDHFRNTPWLEKVIVVESGASLFCDNLYEGASFETCTLKMEVGSMNRSVDDSLASQPRPADAPWSAEPASTWDPQYSAPPWIWTEEQLFPASNKCSEEDITFGVRELLDHYDISMAACGGRAVAGPSTKHARYLKGFGATHEHKT